jgi:hypothetical protein
MIPLALADNDDSVRHCWWLDLLISKTTILVRRTIQRQRGLTLKKVKP